MAPAAAPRSRQLGGPIWAEPMHHGAFVKDLLDSIKTPGADDHYGTRDRMTSMLTLASEVTAAARV